MKKINTKFLITFTLIFIFIVSAFHAYVLYGVKWPIGSVVSFYINANTDQVVNESDAVKSAANSWSRIFPPGLRLSYAGIIAKTTDAYDGENVVFWRNDGDSDYLAYAQFWYWTSNNEIIEADMVFNDYYPWSTSGSHYDIETVALHEFGHWVGLAHSDSGIMQSRYDGIQRNIDGDARAGFLALYWFEEERPSIELDRQSLSFAGTEGSSNPATKIFKVRNSGVKTLHYQTNSTVSWASSFPSSGSSTGEWDDINVGVNISGMKAGNYSGHIRVTSDNADNSPQYLAVNLTIYKDQPPSVSITSPKNGDIVSKTITVKANASDDKGVTKVEFHIDDAYKNTDTSPPYTWNWDTTKSTSGVHTIYARAYDTINQTAIHSVKVTVDQPPKISVTAPLSGSNIFGVVDIKVSATDDFGITKVQFYINGSLKMTDKNSPYKFSWDTNNISNGEYNIKAVAYDTRNQTAQKIITVARIPHAPLSFSGKKHNNSSVLLEQYINVLTWEANDLNEDIRNYRIYQRDGDEWNLLAELGSDTFEYWHINAPKDKKCMYILKAVDSGNREGEQAYLEVQ